MGISNKNDTKEEIHTLAIRKLDKYWWIFDSADKTPINLTEDNEYALRWLTHKKYIDVVTMKFEKQMPKAKH